MSKQDTGKINDPDLWRRFRDGTRDQAGQRHGGAVLDSLTVAAYLDGTLDDAERGRVEALLAHSPDDLELVVAAREALGDPGAPAPDSLVTRSCALVTDDATLADRILRAVESVIESVKAPMAGFRASLWPSLAWSGVAAAMALVCTLGFQLGESGYAGVLAVDQLLPSETLVVLGPSVDEFL